MQVKERGYHKMSVCTCHCAGESVLGYACPRSSKCVYMHAHQPLGGQAREHTFIYTLLDIYIYFKPDVRAPGKRVFVGMCVHVHALDPLVEYVYWRGIHTHTHAFSGGQNVRAIDFLSLRNSL